MFRHIRNSWILVLLLPVLSATAEQSKSVIGPGNVNLTEGAEALLAGDAEEGVRLTLKGLQSAQGVRERQAALGNLCAGYALLEQYDAALRYCNEALAERPRNWRTLSNRALVLLKQGHLEEARRDLDIAQSIAPNARAVKEVRGLFRDATEPVVPSIEIDDRRDGK